MTRLAWYPPCHSFFTVTAGHSSLVVLVGMEVALVGIEVALVGIEVALVGMEVILVGIEIVVFWPGIRDFKVH